MNLPFPTVGLNCPACLKIGVCGRYEASPTIPKAVLVCTECGLMDLEENWIPKSLPPLYGFGGQSSIPIGKTPVVCSICSSSPHKTSCGMWTPYPKG